MWNTHCGQLDVGPSPVNVSCGSFTLGNPPIATLGRSAAEDRGLLVEDEIVHLGDGGVGFSIILMMSLDRPAVVTAFRVGRLLRENTRCARSRRDRARP
jgi:hypothetical protein